MIKITPEVKKCNIIQECRKKKVGKCGSSAKRPRKRTAVSENVQPQKVAKSVNRREKRQTQTAQKTSTSDDMVPCLYCGGLYKDSSEPWIQCLICHDWAHIGCAGVAKNEPRFICERCED